MDIIKKIGILLFVQVAAITVILIIATCVRFFDLENFETLKASYENYARYDVNTSLVYEGKNS